MNQDQSIALFEKCEAARKQALDAGKSEDEAHGAAKAVWNGWANELLAERKVLEDNGDWDARSEFGSHGNFVGENDKTKAWFEKADLDFTNQRFLFGWCLL